MAQHSTARYSTARLCLCTWHLVLRPCVCATVSTHQMRAAFSWQRPAADAQPFQYLAITFVAALLQKAFLQHCRNLPIVWDGVCPDEGYSLAREPLRPLQSSPACVCCLLSVLRHCPGTWLLCAVHLFLPGKDHLQPHLQSADGCWVEGLVEGQS
jgi:hypothetical protein